MVGSGVLGALSLFPLWGCYSLSMMMTRLSSPFEGMDTSSINRSCNWNMSDLPFAMFSGSAIGVIVLPYRLAGLARETWHCLGSLALSFTGVPPDLG